MGGLQLTRSRTLKDLSSYLSGWLSSLPFSRCRSRGAGGQVSPAFCCGDRHPLPSPLSHTQVSRALKVAPRRWMDTSGCPCPLPSHWVQVSLTRATQHPFLSTCGESEPVPGTQDGWARPCPPALPGLTPFTPELAFLKQLFDVDLGHVLRGAG